MALGQEREHHYMLILRTHLLNSPMNRDQRANAEAKRTLNYEGAISILEAWKPILLGRIMFLLWSSIPMMKTHTLLFKGDKR